MFLIFFIGLSAVTFCGSQLQSLSVLVDHYDIGKEPLEILSTNVSGPNVKA